MSPIKPAEDLYFDYCFHTDKALMNQSNEAVDKITTAMDAQVKAQQEPAVSISLADQSVAHHVATRFHEEGYRVILRDCLRSNSSSVTVSLH